MGLAHLTAVSGYHVGLVLGMVSLMFRLLVGRRWVPLLATPAVWALVVLKAGQVGLEGPVVLLRHAVAPVQRRRGERPGR